MNAFTSIEQSKKLAEILSLESADMEYIFLKKDNVPVGKVPFVKDDSEVENSAFNFTYNRIPCWSFAVLLNYLREIDFFPNIEADEHSVTMSINYYDEEEARLLAPVHNIKAKAESFIDACYELIVKYHEQNIL